MDNQGFIVNAPAVKNVKAAKNAAAHTRQAAGKAQHQLNGAVGVVRPKASTDPVDQKIQGLRKVQSRADLVWNGEAIGMLGGGVLGWGAKKAGSQRVGLGVKAVFSAPFEALRSTRLGELHKLPQNYMKAVAKHGKELGGNAESMTAAAERHAASLETRSAAVATNVRGAIAPVTAPVKQTVKSGLDRFETTGAGKTVMGGLESLTARASRYTQQRHLKHLSKAELALTQDVPGMWGQISNFFTRKKPAILDAHPHLEEVTKHLANARSATTNADRLLHMNTAKEALSKVTDSSLASRVGNIEKFIGKSGAAAGMAHEFEMASAKGLSGIASSFGKAVGRVPLFGAILGVGVAAGITATVMTHKKESKEAANARAEIAALIGANNPMMQRIVAAQGKDGRGRVLKSTLSMGSDLANAAMGMSPHGGSMKLMVPAMLPMLTPVLVKDNELLNAYATLRHAEKTGAELPPEARMNAIVQLVSSVPSVAANGGRYNRLTLPVAEAIADKNLSATETMKLLGNDAAFTALASDVAAKQKTTAEALSAHAPQQAAMPAPTADKPATSVGSIAHQGRLAHTQHVARA